MIHPHAYWFTSGDVIFDVYADRTCIPHSRREAAREEYFSKGRPCLRASDLSKKYGCGIHCDGQGRLALIGMEAPENAALIERAAEQAGFTTVKAMRSRKN